MKNKLWGLLIGIVLTVFFMFPVIQNVSTHITSRQDGVLVSWLIDWGSHSIISGENFFNPPFFHPFQDTIGYSDLFFSTAILNLPLIFIQSIFSTAISDFGISQLSLLIINHNLHLIFGTLLVFYAQYLLGLHLFKSTRTALLSAIIFTFSNFHFQYIVHLHVYLMAGLSFYFLFLLKYVKTNKLKYLILTAIAFIYQALNSPMSALFLLLMSILSLFNNKIRTSLIENKKNILLSLSGITLICGFFYLPYFNVSNKFDYTRTIRDSAHFAHSINIFLHPEMLIYLLIPIFFLILSKSKIKNLTQKLPNYFWLFSSFTVLGGILMLGPVIKVSDETLKIFNQPIPLPYAVLYYIFPGFKAFRASSRWIIVFVFGLSITLGYLVNAIQIKKKTKNVLLSLFTILITFFLWITQVPNLETHKVITEIPPIYHVIKQRPETVLAEFPTYVWSQYDDYYKEADRLLFQSYHGKKLYNGFSGFAPPQRENLWHTISDNLGNKEVINHLKDSEVGLIILKGKENLSYKNFSSPKYQLIECIGQDCLYSLR